LTSACPAQGGRRPTEQRLKDLVEASDAAEARCERHGGHGQVGLMQELLRQEHAPGLRNSERRRPEVVHEQAAQMAFAHADPHGQHARIVLVERARLDQPERARDGVRRAPPGAETWRGLWPATQAGTKTRLLRCCRRGQEDAVLCPGMLCRADRAAIDAGGPDRDEESSIEARIACKHRLSAKDGIEVHSRQHSPIPG